MDLEKLGKLGELFGATRPGGVTRAAVDPAAHPPIPAGAKMRQVWEGWVPAAAPEPGAALGKHRVTTDGETIVVHEVMDGAASLGEPIWRRVSLGLPAPALKALASFMSPAIAGPCTRSVKIGVGEVEHSLETVDLDGGRRELVYRRSDVPHQARIEAKSPSPLDFITEEHLDLLLQVVQMAVAGERKVAAYRCPCGEAAFEPASSPLCPACLETGRQRKALPAPNVKVTATMGDIYRQEEADMPSPDAVGGS